MDLSAKIRARYLDEILRGSKKFEYRQFESIELRDGSGRVLRFEVLGVSVLSDEERAAICRAYLDIPFNPSRPLVRLELGSLCDVPDKPAGVFGERG